MSLAQAWGGGEVASADGLRFVVPVRTINAGPNPGYFGVGWGVRACSVGAARNASTSNASHPYATATSISTVATTSPLDAVARGELRSPRSAGS